MKATNIEWTDLSSNPLQYRDGKGRVVWGCVKKSAGCANCYSETIAQRFERGGPFTRATMDGLTPFLDEKELRHILGAKKVDGQPVAGKRCFLGDMTDVFGEWVPDALLDRLFATIAMRPDITFQVLTKRADRLYAYFANIRDEKDMGRWINAACEAAGTWDAEILGDAQWPLRNLWLGVSVENQATADDRIPYLVRTPAAVRFLSCEPLLGELDLRNYLSCPQCGGSGLVDEAHDFVTERVGCSCQGEKPLHQCIVGGESGHGARGFDLQWARSLVRQCKAADTPAFVKQVGSAPFDSGLPVTVELGTMRVSTGNVLSLSDKKGGDPSEWPNELRVREFPRAAA